uniref:HTH_Tnp_Tc3_1 domain-containing protein n=1 Tax=Panagrellus redivivus TaxID=6233 RepID=A0A7E4V9D4_PANRE
MLLCLDESLQRTTERIGLVIRSGSVSCLDMRQLLKVKPQGSERMQLGWGRQEPGNWSVSRHDFSKPVYHNETKPDVQLRPGTVQNRLISLRNYNAKFGNELV